MPLSSFPAEAVSAVSELRISITEPDVWADGEIILVDEFSLIPEPGTLAILAAGAFFVGLSKKRR
ncbi:MAG: PEP-CTERM sorting domain-containing protein [Planctomycetota bacterium]|nr:PEP-CTERM sorting domain-containing protein [Planctomycetota bacterium]